MKDKSEIILKILVIIFFGIFILGGIIVLRYCIGIGYFPVGISVGDSLFFLSVAISFTIVATVYTASVIFISLFIVWLFMVLMNSLLSCVSSVSKSKLPQINLIDAVHKTALLFGAVFTVLFFVSVIFVGLNDVILSTIVFIFSITLILGFLLLTFEDKEPKISAIVRIFQLPEERRNAYIKSILLFCMLIILVVPTEQFYHLSKISLIMISVSKRNVDIYLDGKMKPILYGIDPVDNDGFLIENSDILWTGVGSRSVIKVKIDKKTRKIVVNTSDMSFSY